MSPAMPEVRLLPPEDLAHIQALLRVFEVGDNPAPEVLQFYRATQPTNEEGVHHSSCRLRGPTK